MNAPRRTPFLELVWKVHPWLYRVSGGLVGGRMIGMPVEGRTTRRIPVVVLEPIAGA